MKVYLPLAVLVVIGTLAAMAWFRHRASPPPVHQSFIVELPEGWEEVPNQAPRTYRRRVPQPGVLQISLQKPTAHKITTGEEAENTLAHMLDGLGMDLGERMLLKSSTCPAGLLATALYKSPSRGLLQFWMIPTDVTVFVSYTMGSLDNAKQDIAEASLIVKSIRLE